MYGKDEDMKLAALVSGGKDSLYAMYLAGKSHEIRVIVTIKSLNPESYMYHVPNIDLVKLQAKAMRLPLILKQSMGKKEEELIDLKEALLEAKARYGIEGVVSGAIFSNYQRGRIDGICNELGLKSLAPLWKRDPKELWNEMFEAGFEVIISAVAAYGLTEEWLGRYVDRNAFDTLCDLHGTCYVCTGGEGGEFETLVVYCPLF
ncbi:MAG: diphthine--ammonia ligase, partial [Candidatus Methanospirareceae archaeon]